MADVKKQCYFLINGEKCPNNRDLRRSPYCPEHRAVFAPLDNPTLLEQAVRNQRKMMYVSEDKKLTAKADREVIDEFINVLHELNGRGYRTEEAVEAIGRVMQETGIMDDLFKEIGEDPKWKKLEKLVAGIHMLKMQGAEVKVDDHIVGKRTSRERQIDVSIRFKQGFYDYLAIVECKDYGSRVPMEKVEAFRTKIEDVGAMHGIMVSSHGFQEGAIATAKAHNIELFTLTEVKSDWTKKISAYVHTFPWPTKIEFDHPDFDTTDILIEPVSFQYKDLLFYKDQHNPPIPLYVLVGNIANWADERRLKLPCIVESPINPPLLVQFPGTNFYTPIYGIAVTLEPRGVSMEREIDIPPKLEKYLYSDLTKERVHEIPAEDVPKIK